MQCPRCAITLDAQAVFCGNCGAHIQPQSRPETIFDQTGHSSTNTRKENTPLQTLYAAPQSNQRAPFLPDNADQGYDQTVASQHPITPAPTIAALPRALIRPKKKSQFALFSLFMLIGILIVGGLASGYLVYQQQFTQRGGGQVSFSDSEDAIIGQTNALKIDVRDLDDPPPGSHYRAWLIDNQNEQVTLLGTLQKETTHYRLSFSGEGNAARKNLLALGNLIEIRQEQGEGEVPTGNVVMRGTFPPQAYIHIRHILTSFPSTPEKIGLLVGLLNETQKVYGQSIVLQSSAAIKNSAATVCITQNIINIIEGKNGEHYRPLSQACPAQNIADSGDTFGLLGKSGYVNQGINHATLAGSQPDSTDFIRQKTGTVVTSLSQVKEVLAGINANALQVLDNPEDAAKIAAIVSLAERAYHGFDKDGNGKIEPVKGEAGAITAYKQGQLVATLTLQPA